MLNLFISYKQSCQFTWKMRLLVLISGRGNSIFLSIRPGRSKAGSRLSIVFVAKMTLTSPLESNPSNWFSNSNMVLWISRSPPEWASYLQTKDHQEHLINSNLQSFHQCWATCRWPLNSELLSIICSSRMETVYATKYHSLIRFRVQQNHKLNCPHFPNHLSKLNSNFLSTRAKINKTSIKNPKNPIPQLPYYASKWHNQARARPYLQRTKSQHSTEAQPKTKQWHGF